MKNRRFLWTAGISVIIPAAVAFVASAVLAGTTLTVNTTADILADDDLCSLREAIIAANTDTALGGCPAGSGADTIRFDASLPVPAVFQLTLTGAGEDSAATGDLDITGTLTIEGAGTDQTILDGNGFDRVFDVQPGAVVSLNRLTVRHGNPGALEDGGGILVRLTGKLTINDGLVTANSGLHGGGIKNFGGLTMNVSTVSANLGGGLMNDGGGMALNLVAISGNSGGYGLRNQNQASLAYDGGFVDANSAGGIYNETSTAVLSHLEIMNNSTGGGVVNTGGTLSRITVTNSFIHDNTATSGAGIFNAGVGAVAQVKDSRISSNQADAAGGGIYNAGSMTLNSSTVDHNLARTGGGIDHSGGSLNMTNDSISGNSASDNGGGLYNRGDAILLNITFLANQANGAGTGGNVFNDTASMSLKNTIVAGADTDGNCFNSEGFINSLGYNLDSGNTCGFSSTGDLVNTDPQLGPLQDNGGPTPTHAIPATSPAVDHGDETTCPVVDQRGAARPTDGNGDGISICDIGAFEANAVVPTATFTVTATTAATDTATPTAANTATVAATETPSPPPADTATSTATATPGPSETSTDMPTPAPSDTGTAIPTPSETPQPSETPSPTATLTPTPEPVLNTPGKVTGGGVIVAPESDTRLTLGFVIKLEEGQSAPTGQLVFIDHQANVRLFATEFDLLVIEDRQARWSGMAMVNGTQKMRFEIEVIDREKPDEQDDFYISIPALDGYRAGGVISGGAIRIHKD